jgi:hypothetical protein
MDRTFRIALESGDHFLVGSQIHTRRKQDYERIWKQLRRGK